MFFFLIYENIPIYIPKYNDQMRFMQLHDQFYIIMIMNKII